MKGTSVLEFRDRFPDEESCLRHVFRQRFGPEGRCPNCGVSGKIRRAPKTKKYNHLLCRTQFSVLKDTIFYRSNLSLMAWFYCLLLFCNFSNGVRSSLVRKQLGLGVKSAHRLCNRIRLHLACYARPEKLGGPGKKVYIDETHIKYLTSRRTDPRAHAWVMGIACDGKVLTGIVNDRKSSTFRRAIDRFVEPDSIIVTDQYRSYAWLKRAGWQHIAVNHSRAFHDFYGTDNIEIETYWAVLKRALRSYRQTTPENLWLFIAEIECRYNHRHDERSFFDAMIECFPALHPYYLEETKSRYVWA